MRYSYEFKMKCIEMYRNGMWPETPKGISDNRFHTFIWEWNQIEKSCGPEGLKHKKKNRRWSAEDKYELIVQVLAGNPCYKVAISNGVSSGQLYNWVRKYKTMGYNGLVEDKRGRPCKEPKMKKKNKPTPLTESEREELIRLRTENEYIKAENEVIKKEIALREEREAARLKAKKQQSSKNSKNKDSN